MLESGEDVRGICAGFAGHVAEDLDRDEVGMWRCTDECSSVVADGNSCDAGSMSASRNGARDRGTRTQHLR